MSIETFSGLVQVFIYIASILIIPIAWSVLTRKYYSAKVALTNIKNKDNVMVLFETLFLSVMMVFFLIAIIFIWLRLSVLLTLYPI